MKRLAPVMLLWCIAAGAFANGAMGLGLEVFDMRFWTAYVVAIVVMEAWLIGRWLYLSWVKSILLAVLANGVTAMLCPTMAAPFLHGSELNPNPLARVLSLLFWSAALSALVEGAFWQVFARGSRDGSKILGRSYLVHFIGIPVGLAILLLPPRPYLGIEATTEFRRRWALGEALDNAWAQEGSIPTRAEDLVRQFGDRERHGEDLWTAAYLPRFGRFDFGERRSTPWEVNPRINLLRNQWVGEGESNPEWLVRVRIGNWVRGWVSGPQPTWTGDPIQLGYRDPKP